ncbi:MAG: hypothetical protein JXR22_04580 [Prolixibacteraceae bacterium]|nr:hypothetical protein [Prolixibacteraceae bacterium]
MANLIIVRKKQRIYRNKPVSIYLNQKKIGIIQNGSPVSFSIDEGVHSVMPVTGLFRGPGTKVNTRIQEHNKLELSVHPAVQLLYMTLAVSAVFISLVFLMFNDRLNPLFIGLLLIPLILVMVLGLIFMRKYFFVLRNAGE